jgi:hypothetical protein
MNLFTALLSILGAAVLLMLIFFLNALITGFVLTKLWLWFVVPTFGVAALSIPAAYGMGMLVVYLTRPTTAFRSEVRDIPTEVAATILTPALALTLGWAAKTFFM